MRAIDRRAVEEFHIPVDRLMENAGRAVASEALRIFKDFKIAGPGNVFLLCGGGNNGGDGFVAARILHERGVSARVALLKSPGSLKGATLSNFERLAPSRIPYQIVSEIDNIAQLIRESDLLIDALLGTGFKDKVSGHIEEVIASMNASGKPILAVDIPSGMDGDTGEPRGACVRAGTTVTMGALKKGLVAEGAGKWTGKVIVADIGFPEGLFRGLPTIDTWNS